MSFGFDEEVTCNPAKIFSVSELTRSIRSLLELRFAGLWVQGEISNYKLHSSGHQYFTLKDSRAQVSCVAFRNTLPPPAIPLADGTQVQVYGQISVFEARGQYQLTVQLLQTRGAGLLQAKFDALKRKLGAEGLFDSARKRPLPKFPVRIGVVTSPNGAAIRDIINVLQRRAPWVHLLINPVRVQGAGAALEIANAIRELTFPNDKFPPCDLVVVTRGGGSIEDLWEFNEEIVARAIFDSPIAIVSAIGHEIDFTIADFVADLRAPTPSAAAELIVPDAADLGRRIAELAACLQRSLRNLLTHARSQLRFLSEKSLGREPQARLRGAQQQLDHARERLLRKTREQLAAERVRLVTAIHAASAHNPARELTARREALSISGRQLRERLTHAIGQIRQRLDSAKSLLRVLGPDATLARGYSITRDASGNLIRSASFVRKEMVIRTRVADGEFESRI